MKAQPDFICAICLRTVCGRWGAQRGPDRALPPLCRYCEQSYTAGVGKPSAGSFRDRREVMRGFALAEALRCEAMQKTWERRYGA